MDVTYTFGNFEEITNTSDIQETVDLLNQLKTKQITPIDPGINDDRIQFQFNYYDETKKIFSVNPNQWCHYEVFVKPVEPKYYAMDEDEYHIIKILCCKLIKNKYINDPEYGTITGQVLSVETDETERLISCTIKDDSSNIHEIVCSEADIYDISQFTWLTLHVKDSIDVIYKKDASDSKFNAHSIFIVSPSAK